MIGYQEKPIILGEFGTFRHIYPSLKTGICRMQAWLVESCEVGFDGWLTWEYYNRPADECAWGLENEELMDRDRPGGGDHSSRDPLWATQYPEGETLHQIRVRDSHGNLTEVHRFEQFTHGGEWLVFTPETPISDVVAMCIDTLKSPSWVAWSEIEIYGE
jgi:hypothetical protein